MSLGGVIGGWPKREITKYRTERVVKSVEEDKSALTPGLLCWGATGTLPAPVPVSTDFETVKTEHKELWRETEDVEIHDVNNPDKFVVAARTKRMGFEVQEVNPKFTSNNNTQTGGEDLSDFGSDMGPVDLSPKTNKAKSGQLKVIFSNNDGTI